MRRGMDIVFRPRIWDHGALTFSLEARPIFRATAAGRVATPPTPTPPHASTTSTLDYPISLAYAMRKFWDTEQQTSASGTLLRRIYISLVLRTVTHYDVVPGRSNISPSTPHGARVYGPIPGILVTRFIRRRVSKTLVGPSHCGKSMERIHYFQTPLAG